ncbi:filamentous haemagglutinin family protein [Novosphingobium gossypii]|uniref:filamentous haemagglutinin family protein n=1 Tax=Novosphingobium gossypii TaxID=1604774 RepID=UPI003D25AF43
MTKTRSPHSSSPRPNPLRNALLIGASATSLIVPGLIVSGGALAQSRVFSGRGGTADPAAAAANAAAAQATRAAQTSSASQRALEAFRRAAQSRATMSAAQNAARSAAQAAQSGIANGLAQGGLQVANGVATDPSLWVGANGPAQTTGADGRTAVTIDQTQQKAILTWDSFNLGRETDLTFRQGGADWVALNRVTDASADPTRIMGSIKAPGSVYILNRNGVIFGGTAQVNVRNLVAGAANITNDQFLNRGIYSALSGSNYLAAFTDAGGAVKVEAGARITTNAPTSVTAGGGFVMLLGSTVTNAGSISTPRGQTLLSAGDDFIVRRGYGTAENLYSTTRGNEVRGLIDAGSRAGTVANTGQIEAAQGDITLAGRTIRQDGVLYATTSVNQRGTIHLLNSASDAEGSVTLGKDSLTLIAPETGSTETALDGQRDALIAASDKANLQRGTTTTGGFDDRSLLADRVDQSRIEIVTGGNVLFEGGSQTMANGGQVAVQASKGRITVASGASIDVSGVMGVSLDMASNSILVNVQGNELRDSPANRDATGTALKSRNVWVDVRDLVLLPDGTGGYEGDRWYTRGGLLELGGYIGNTAHTIGEWAAVGGTITLAANEVVAQQGAVLDISGGSLDYAGGYVRSSLLLGADGRMYDIRNAPAWMKFVSVGNAFQRKHDRWGEQYTQTYASKLFSRSTSSRWEDGYSVGRDAGKVILSTPTALMEANILAEAFQGERQIQARTDGLTDGYKAGQYTAASAGSLAVGRYDAFGRTDLFDTDIRIGDIADVTAGLATSDALAEDRIGTVWLDAARLNAQSLGRIELGTRAAVTIESNITLANGGTLDITAPTIDINANITAKSGSIRASNVFSPQLAETGAQALMLDGKAGVSIAAGAILDLRGVWTNGLDGTPLFGLADADGGSITLQSTQDVVLGEGSLIDVSSGGALLENGSFVGGHGGNVILQADYEEAVGSTSGRLSLAGTVTGNGAAGGGKLLVQSRAIRIGDPVATAEEAATVLNADLFASGFSDYEIVGNRRLEVAEGTSIDAAMPVYRLGANAGTVASNGDPAAALELWTPPLYQENPLSGLLTQRQGASLTLRNSSVLRALGDVDDVNLTIGKGARVTVDAGRRIGLTGPGSIAMHGTLQAAGGDIEIVQSGFSVNELSGAAGVPEPTGQTIWIGEDALIDVAGRSVTAVDAQGRRYGIAGQGGTITIGGAIDHATGKAGGGTNFVVIREGALLDASGSQANLDISGARGVAVAGSGGTISLGSLFGLYLHGDMKAAAGGSGAAGGTLDLSLGTTLISTSQPSPLLSTPREMLLSSTRKDIDQFGAMTPSEAAASLVYGHGAISMDQITEGGFGSLGLAVRGQVSFTGDIDLSLAQGVHLYARSLALAESAHAGSRITISAPYLRLAGAAPIVTNIPGLAEASIGGTSTRETEASLTLNGSLIDLRDEVNFGANGTLPRPGGTFAYDRRDFARVALNSIGDIRVAGGGYGSMRLNVAHALEMTAAQIYPTTHAAGQFSADTIRIGRSTEALPAVPQSVFGSLMFEASSIEQGGVVRAPLGTVQFGRTGLDPTRTIDLLDSSVTSISGNGLVMPYGGTVDGIRYDYDGKSLADSQLGRTNLSPGLTLNGQAITVDASAVIDVSGGGTLNGAGFISGRGGSVDVLRHAMAEVNPGFPISKVGNEVYALVPSHTGPAPLAPDAGAGDPLIGQQITLSDAVPGLPAGTYTLMPSTYALQKGAFRIEIAAADLRSPATAPVDLKNGSHVLMGRLGIAGTAVREALARQVIVTPASVVRTYSLYNETDYEAFVLADAARRSAPRIRLPRDAGQLAMNFEVNRTDRPSLTFEGALRNAPAKDGWGGQVALRPATGSLEVVAEGTGATAGFTGITLEDGDINALHAGRLLIGGTAEQNNGTSEIAFKSSARDIAVRSGATLLAGDIFLVSGLMNGAITVEQGAILNTVGKGRPGQDSSDGFIFAPGTNSVFAVGNSIMTMRTTSDGSNGFGPGRIDIGTCALVCAGETQLYSEGTIVAATNKAFTFGNGMRYGTRNLTLAVGGINVGTDESLAAARSAGILPAGLELNQTVLDRLLQGDTTTGAPALETLVLTARDSINFFGTVTLDTMDAATGKSRLANLVMTSGGIYGHGTAADVATIRTGNLFWNGGILGVESTANPAIVPTGNASWNGGIGEAPSVVAGGAGNGSGSLMVDAQRIEFGFGPDTVTSMTARDRLALGFATVNLTASERVTANHVGTFAVYQAQSAFVPGKGFTYSGGDLNIVAPLVTVGAGASNTIKAGGAIRLTGTGAAAGAADLGGTLAISGRTVTVDTAIMLPSGKLTLSAMNDLTLSGASRIDVAGREVPFDDISRYSWGGDVVLTSTLGNIRQDAASVIDMSARFNNAGRLMATALDGTAGLIDLQGSILGASSGEYDAGGTIVPYQGGMVDLRAQKLGDFAALNTRLNAGEVFGARAFQIKQGDLTIGNELKARSISLSLDGGALLVTGKVDASGAQVGSIRLHAAQGLTLAGTAQLDAHGTLLRVDSYGKIIDSPNRAMVELSSGSGMLALQAGARIDLRHGTAAAVGSGAGQHDGKARGTLELNAPRLGTNDVAIDASGPLSIVGARSIAVNAVRSYGDAELNTGTESTVDGRPYHSIDQAWMDRRHDENTAFIDAALNNTGLMGGKLAGLNNAAYANAFHLRPTVEVASSGDLVVSGDIDLSEYRYDGVNPTFVRNEAIAGSGEIGSLVLRSGGDLTVFGSITDGFITPPDDMPEKDGWVLLPGEQLFNTPIVVPRDGIVLHAGTRFNAGGTLNYEVTLQGMTVAQGTRLPNSAALADTVTLPADTVLSGDILNADGTIAHAAGTRLIDATVLRPGMVLGAGTVLVVATPLGQMVWPKDVPLPHRPEDTVTSSSLDTVSIAEAVTLPMGGLIPAGARLELGAGVEKVDLRSEGGLTYALAPMLPEGSQSWNIRLVAGADLGAADNRLTNPNAAHGSLILADTHFGMTGRPVRTGGEPTMTEEGALALIGDPSYAGLTRAEIEEKATAEFGFPVTFEILAGQSFADFCSSGGNCTAGGPLILTEEGALSLIGDPSYAGLLPQEFSDKMLADFGYPFTMEEFFGIPMADLCASSPAFCTYGGGDLSFQYTPSNATLSVLRTGTGDLDLISARDLAVRSLYGVYTAGTSSLSLADARASGVDVVRPTTVGSTIVDNPGHQQYVDGSEQSLYRAWYPDQGGNLSLTVGGDLTGDLLGRRLGGTQVVGERQFASSDVGNWLWRQASAQGTGAATAWWINFGTYASASEIDGTVGFTGFGTLGGGNIDVRVGGDAGLIEPQGAVGYDAATRSQGLVLAVASTGRVIDGELTQTGGGDIAVRIGGGLNPALSASGFGSRRHDLNGKIVNLRGTVQVDAGGMGWLEPTFGAAIGRTHDPFAVTGASAGGGIVLTPGDATVRLNTRANLVLGSVTDAGRVQQRNGGAFVLASGRTDGPATISGTGGSFNWFSLWTDRTAVDVFAAGGSLNPFTASAEIGFGSPNPLRASDVAPTDGRYVYPSILRAVAGSGNIVLGGNAYSLMLAPGSKSELELLAGNSIFARGLAITPSSADMSSLVTPFNPGTSFAGQIGDLYYDTGIGMGPAMKTSGTFPLFGFGYNTSGNTSGAAEPVRFYAREGDIAGLRTGEILTFGLEGITLYEGARPVWMKAGRDIVDSGTRLSQPGQLPTEISGSVLDTATGNLFVHTRDTDVSLVHAGRDILFSSFAVAGPGTLEIMAGRDLVMEDVASVTSIGPIVAVDARPGASIAMAAGMANSVDWGAVRSRYLDPARLADPQFPLAHPNNASKVAKVYDAELAAWLGERYGFSGTRAEALDRFDALAPEQQRIFLREIYYAEVREGGREYNDPDSPRFASYLRGREMIAALFPDADASGAEIARPGDILMFGGAGVRSNFGGNIEMMAPGGQIVVGLQGEVPPASAGVVTQGQGDIRLFSEKSLLLGLSRILTTFGGDIFAWSEKGDINAGRGAKTTVLYTPPLRTYDPFGNVRLSPQVPSAGGGIGTLNPIPEVPAGDIDLIAPLGTIDAGEAGIRVSGNINLAALQVLNAANIQVQGNASGIPQVAVVNTGALTAASSATGAIAAQAAQLAERARPQPLRDIPAIITSRLIGFGDE